MKRILVVDDERQITRMLRSALQASGYEVATAGDGVEALGVFQRMLPDLVITDLSMPGMGGVELTRSIRALANTPILVLTVRSSESQKVTSLDGGADDYLTKPFGMPELLARVRALLRRTDSPAVAAAVLEAGDFSLDIEAHTCCLQGEAIRLSPKEFDLLKTLLQQSQRVVPHRELLRSIWGPAGDDQPEYLRVLVASLRKRLENAAGKEYIQSEPRIGYRVFPSGIARG